MRKIVALWLIPAFFLCLATPASAVDFKVGGSMEFLFEQYANVSTNPYYAFQDSKAFHHNTSSVPHAPASLTWYHGKHNRALQRLILNLTITASPNLYAYYDTIIGFHTWGGPATGVGPYAQNNGGALGSRSANIISRSAFLNWTIPHTRINIRLGQQIFMLPGFATGTLPIKTEWGTGIVASAPLTDRVSATAIWQRANSGPRRGSSAAWPQNEHTDDTFDVFALTVPVKLDGFRFAPYLALSIQGQDSNMIKLLYDKPNGWGQPFTIQNLARDKGYSFGDQNIMPLWGASAYANINQGTRFQPGTATGWYVGLGGEMTRYDPFRIGFDFAWTKATTDHEMFNRGGWYFGMAASYKTKYGVPAFKGWITSGDDGDINNGSERPLAWNGSYPDASLLAASWSGFACNGNESGSVAGTWGVSLQWNKVSFVEKLSHNLRLFYIQGTNNKKMVRYAKLGWDNRLPATPGFVINYMSTADSLVEIDLENVWQIQPNLRLLAEGACILPHFDAKAWGYWNADHTRLLQKAQFSKSWRVSMVLRYDF